MMYAVTALFGGVSVIVAEGQCLDWYCIGTCYLLRRSIYVARRLGLSPIVMRLDIHYHVLQLNAAIQMKLFPLIVKSGKSFRGI